MPASKNIAAVMVLAAYGLLAPACVSIPVPPTDFGSTKSGELGRLVISAKYEPNWIGTTQAALRSWSSNGKTVVKQAK